MKWPQWYPMRGDMMGILFVLIAICVTSFGFWFPKSQPNPSAGFGAYWDCKSVANGEPVCIKFIDEGCCRVTAAWHG